MYKERRKFIKLSITVAGIAITGSFSGCLDASKEEKGFVNNHNYDEKDIRLLVLSYAILAPNPHNKQPWLIELKDEKKFDLYVDTDRTLPYTDPFFRQIHIGQGTFLENLNLAALNFGYQANINYFPKGEYSNTLIENKPVASIELIKKSNIKKDRLFSQIFLRQSNKREYINKPTSIDKLKKLQKQIEIELSKDFLLNISNKKEEITKLREILVKGMEIETGNSFRDLETIEMFRFNDHEINQYKDGFGLAQSGVSGIKKFMIENFFLSRESTEKNPQSFGKESINVIQRQVDSTNTFAWLVSKNNTRVDQLKTGRIYERINLMATSLGLVIHPISQVLQEYSDMNGLQKEFLEYLNIEKKHTVQMLFRIGEAPKVSSSPRREIKNFIIS